MDFVPQVESYDPAGMAERAKAWRNSALWSSATMREQMKRNINSTGSRRLSVDRNGADGPSFARVR